MKRTRKLMVLSVVVALVLNLVAGMAVFAEEVKLMQQTFTVDNRDAESIVVSVDFNMKSDKYFEIRLWADNPPVAGNPMGLVGFRPTDNKLQINDSATSWMGSEWGTGFGRGVAYTPGTMQNVTMRLTKATGTVDYYLNGKYTYSGTATAGCGNWTKITVHNDKGGSFNDFEWSIKSVSTHKADEVGVKVSRINEESKTIVFDFTEEVSGSLEKVKLIRVNGGVENEITNTVLSGATLTCSYTDDLELGEEYVLVLPDNIQGIKYGYKPENHNFYFSTNGSESTTVQLKTFEEEDTDAFLIREGESKTENVGTVTDGGNGSDKGLKITSAVKTIAGTDATVTYGTFNNLMFTNLKYPVADADVRAISFDIKPLVENLGLTMRFINGSANPIIMGIDSNTQVLYAGANSTWGDNLQGQLDVNATNKNWWALNHRLKQNDSPIAMEKDTWTNFRIEYDTRTKLGAFYINGVQANTMNKAYDICNTKVENFTQMVFIAYTKNMGIAETSTDMFLIDNIKTESIERPINVSKVRFNDVNGNSIGTYNTLDAALASVDVTFSDAMTLGETSENIKLYYGEDEVAYTGVYNADTKCYTMAPSVAADVPDKDYRVEVKGITTTSGVAVADYTCAVFTDVHTFVKAMVEVVNASDDVVTEIEPGISYKIKSSFISNASEVTSIPVLIAEYLTDGTVSKVSIKKISADEDIPYEIDVDAEIYPSKVKVFAWYSIESVLPLCKNVELSVINQ